MNRIKHNYIKIAAALIITFLSHETIAQVVPLKSQFFENTALINPAYAGAKKEGIASLTYSSQLNKLDGAPKVMSAIVHAPLSEKVGLGLTFVNDKAGLISHTTVLGAYSYKVKFEGNSAIRFGLGAGILNDKLSDFDANSPNKSSDPALSNYNNNHGLSFKVAMGALFTKNNFEAQLAWHDLAHQLANEPNTINDPGLTASVAYKINVLDSSSFKPLVGIRQVRGYNTYYDFGVNADYLDIINITALYHTNKTFTGGVGVNYKDNIRLVFLYSTQVPQYGNIMGPSYEILLSVPFRLKR